MKADEKIIGEVIRVEVDEITGDVYLVFKVVDEATRRSIKKNWTDDIEFEMINKKLIEKE